MGGSAVSRHTRRSISCSPRAAARVSRSSSAAECSPADALPASSSRFCAFLLGDEGGEQVGEGERGVGGSERSTASCIAAPSPPAPSAKRKGKPSAEDDAAPETGERASGGTRPEAPDEEPHASRDDELPRDVEPRCC